MTKKERIELWLNGIQGFIAAAKNDMEDKLQYDAFLDEVNDLVDDARSDNDEEEGEETEEEDEDA